MNESKQVSAAQFNSETLNSDEEIVIITNRFATAEFALAWSSTMMTAAEPVYRSIGQPYNENKIKYAPIAVDCEKVIKLRRKSGR